MAGCEVDHIISRKHGGSTELPNLALSCARCNRAKGTDVASIHFSSGALIRLFHPRRDHWTEHFRIEGAKIVGRTLVGEVTVTLLRLNENERLLERNWLQRAKYYPEV